MRRIRARGNGEQGAVAVFVALILVVLLAFAALAVDAGMLYSERAQVQNGSDAAALAVAQKCAVSISDPNCSVTPQIAKDLANKNSIDSRGNINSVNLDLTNRTVTVSAGSQQAGGGANSVSLVFARALGINTAEVLTSSTVQWGSPLTGTTPFPLTFSVCQVQGQVGGNPQLLQAHGSGANPGCNYGPSGAAVEGGFGWTVQNPGSCGGYIDLALSEGGSAPGNSIPTNCAGTLNKWADTINAGKDVIVLLPVFNAVTGTGSGAIYHLVSFAAFKVIGWKFSGNSSLPDTFRNASPYVSSALSCSGNCRGIVGTFVKYVSLADGYTLGPVSAHGATIVRLTK
ncbi:pilus assembly protein TadG-related protein [Paenarthrobacter sp. NCHU4564]|uniref:pilus assembly protein TadG-related protein n=1 Tax=Paenarthrobacter sp. NCHU4564 TaxID=3451353 RepID=UPI003F95DA64